MDARHSRSVERYVLQAVVRLDVRLAKHGQKPVRVPVLSLAAVHRPGQSVEHRGLSSPPRCSRLAGASLCRRLFVGLQLVACAAQRLQILKKIAAALRLWHNVIDMCLLAVDDLRADSALVAITHQCLPAG